MHLSGAAYPASRADLLRYAEVNRAFGILPVLASLPERRYGSALEVVKAVVAPESAGAALPTGALAS